MPPLSETRRAKARQAFLIAALLTSGLGAGAWLLSHDHPPAGAEHDHGDEAGEHDHGDHGHDEHGHGDHEPGRETTITAAAARAAGLELDTAGPATLADTVEVAGRIALNGNRHARVEARFPGLVREVRKAVGDRVEAGEVMALVESNESLQPYAVKAPLAGTVLARTTNAGAVAGDGGPLFEVADLSTVWAELHVFARDAGRVAAGRAVALLGADGAALAGTIDHLRPLAEAGSQSVVALAVLPNDDGRWRPGQAVTGRIEVGRRDVPLAVKASALQQLGEDTVVFVRQGERYEAHPVRLGQRAGDLVEVLAGLEPGARYVSGNSFLVKADIEKSGAGHDH